MWNRMKTPSTAQRNSTRPLPRCSHTANFAVGASADSLTEQSRQHPTGREVQVHLLSMHRTSMSRRWVRWAAPAVAASAEVSEAEAASVGVNPDAALPVLPKAALPKAAPRWLASASDLLILHPPADRLQTEALREDHSREDLHQGSRRFSNLRR